jgi:Gene product 88
VTVEQLNALKRYASVYGRCWKQELNLAWQNGSDCQEPDGNYLRQVRNQFGPSWLVKFSFKKNLTHMNTTLFFGKGSNNAKLRKLEEKLGRKVYTFSLPAGYTCPGASKCLTKFDRTAIKEDGKMGKIVDGPRQEFRCFAASMEAVFVGFRDNNSSNLELLKSAGNRSAMKDLILTSLPPQAQVVRIHVSGDFFSEEYLCAWIDVAIARPDVQFYGYTKSLRFIVAHLSEIPSNLSITASEGGKWDHLIQENGLKSSRVVMSIEEASVLGLAIDHDDSHAAIGRDSFALLIHGQQRKGSKAAEALKLIA